MTVVPDMTWFSVGHFLPGGLKRKRGCLRWYVLTLIFHWSISVANENAKLRICVGGFEIISTMSSNGMIEICRWIHSEVTQVPYPKKSWPKNLIFGLGPWDKVQLRFQSHMLQIWTSSRVIDQSEWRPSLTNQWPIFWRHLQPLPTWLWNFELIFEVKYFELL